MGEYGDEKLLELFQNKSTRHDAFSRIVTRYKERLYWHIRKIVVIHEDADDVLQNTFLKAWKGLESFRQESQLYTWLYRIATNEAISFLSQKRNKSVFSMEEVEMNMVKSLHDDMYFSGDELQLHLQKAILGLPEKQRIVFNMKYFDDIPYEEMSGILDTSVGALKASYHHAVKKIKHYFDQIT